MELLAGRKQTEPGAVAGHSCSSRRRLAKAVRRQKWKATVRLRQPPADQLLYRLVKDAGVEDLIHLLFMPKPDSEDLVIYDHAARGTCLTSNIPWPIRWLCTRYNRKHVLHSRRPPDADRFRNSCEQFERKIK